MVLLSSSFSLLPFVSPGLNFICFLRPICCAATGCNAERGFEIVYVRLRLIIQLRLFPYTDRVVPGEVAGISTNRREVGGMLL